MNKKAANNKTQPKDQRSKEKRKGEEPPLTPWLTWLRANWRATLLISAVTLLVFFMKIHEEMSGGVFNTAPTEDLYAVLGLDSNADIKEIRKQFNKLAVEFHPDRHPDCGSCADRFRRISAAYEVLSSPEAKEHYDQTAGVLEPIRSATTSLTVANFQRLVAESPYVWIVQVFSESSSGSQNFAGFWEEFAAEHSFLHFGRINMASQSRLVARLPFSIDELPTVLSFAPGQPSELLEMEYDRSPNAALKSFVRTALGESYQTIGPEAIPSLAKSKGSKAKLLLVNFDSPPIFFLYISQRFGQYWDFFSTAMGTHKTAQQKLGEPAASAQLIPGHLPANPLPDRTFTAGQSPAAMRALLSYAMATTLPGELTRALEIRL